MGRGDACPNSAEISRLGWSTPAEGGDNISSLVLATGSTRTFTLPATYLSPTGNYLRIVPDWVANYSEITIGKNLYVALRMAKGGDASLGSFYAGKVNIHEVNATLVSGFGFLFAPCNVKLFSSTQEILVS